ncbi:MAG: hypothetical protein A2X06_02320 [Bacteroidetes bacterium GWC2_40_22]|nr:MAG: hypothetical protein A2X06_02320 [Bacteroidetes bacterium GWC2_40_22]
MDNRVEGEGRKAEGLWKKTKDKRQKTKDIRYDYEKNLCNKLAISVFYYMSINFLWYDGS